MDMNFDWGTKTGFIRDHVRSRPEAQEVIDFINFIMPLLPEDKTKTDDEQPAT